MVIKDQTNRIEEELTDHVLEQMSQDEPKPLLTLPPLEFIRQFSSINEIYSPSIYLNHTAAAAVHTETPKPLAGNSRDPPSPFLFVWENKFVNNCSYKHKRRTVMARHEVSCEYQKESESKRISQCTQCSTKVASQLSLNRQIKD